MPGKPALKIEIQTKTIRNIVMSFLVTCVLPQLDFSNFKFVQTIMATEETIKKINK